MNIAFAGFRHPHILGLYDNALKNENVHISGCFEEDSGTRADLKNINFNYASYEDVLNDTTVDAIAIGDYYQKRGRMIIAALNHGKHIICDKPLCTDPEELLKIRELSEKNNLKVACMLDLRYMPQTAAVRKLLSGDVIGKIHIASFTGQHCLNYGARPGWYFEEGKHGGTINDIAIHGIDLLRFITKKNLTKINCAKTWNAFADKEPDFKDCAQFMIEMDDMGVMADVSYAAPSFGGIMPTYWDFKLWGTKGMLSFNFKEGTIHIFKGTEEVIECEQAVTGYLDDFLSEINGAATAMDTADILNSQEQVLKIQKYANEMR